MPSGSIPPPSESSVGSSALPPPQPGPSQIIRYAEKTTLGGLELHLPGQDLLLPRKCRRNHSRSHMPTADIPAGSLGRSTPAAGNVSSSRLTPSSGHGLPSVSPYLPSQGQNEQPRGPSSNLSETTAPSRAGSGQTRRVKEASGFHPASLATAHSPPAFGGYTRRKSGVGPDFHSRCAPLSSPSSLCTGEGQPTSQVWPALECLCPSPLIFPQQQAPGMPSR